MLRLLCWLLGHKWPITHVGEWDGHEFELTHFGSCGRCGLSSGNDK
jgi:hypothetical protein